MSAQHTPGPWYVRDLRSSEMRRLGWTGPSIDRLLITNKTGPEMARDEGEDCVVARIQFDNRSEELGDGNLADARLIAAAPDLLEASIESLISIGDLQRALHDALHIIDFMRVGDGSLPLSGPATLARANEALRGGKSDGLRAAIAKAKGSAS